jgi:hypothetical protein
MAAFADLVVADLADLEEVPVYFVTQVALVEGLATVRAAGEGGRGGRAGRGGR